MTAGQALERLGFDTVRLRYTLRTALAACLAILAASLLGLDHPQWAGMTVWAASQPVRGQLLEKSLFRIAGTVLGAVFGIGLLLVSGGQAWIIVLGLSVWIGLCAGAGNVVRGFVSYGAMLAGYSAAMVTLVQAADAGNDFAVGIDRMLTVLLGVGVALAVGWAFAARGGVDAPAGRVGRLTGRVLADLARHLEGGAAVRTEEYRHLLSEMAVIEEGLDGHAAGSLRARKMARGIGQLLSAQVAVLMWMHRPTVRQDPDLAHDLRHAAALAERPDALDTARQLVERTAARAGDPVLGRVLAHLAQAMAAQGAAGRDAPAEAGPAFVRHRDWVGARQALVRACLAIFAVGALWLLTGWRAGAFMLLGTAIMLTIFSTMDNPVRALRHALLGQALGVAGALACRWLVWPHAGSESGLLLAMMPFVFAGAFLLVHRRPAGPIGFDYSMVLLLLLHPAWPLEGSLSQSLTASAAVLLGPVAAMAAYRLLFPIDGRKRLRALAAMMVREVEAMAARRGIPGQRALWRARLYHRVLRLVRWADKTGGNRGAAVEGAFAVLLLGSAVIHIDELLRLPGLAPRGARLLDLALARARRAGSDPRRAARALARVARRLAGHPAVDTELLSEAAAELLACAGFLLTDGQAGGHATRAYPRRAWRQVSRAPAG